MADLGDIIGSMMTGIIRARRLADEETAALAEHYRENPLLEELTVPRIRIPELTIDFPIILEDLNHGGASKLKDIQKIKKVINEQLNLALTTNNIKPSANFKRSFQSSLTEKLSSLQKRSDSVSKEILVREVQKAFSESLKKSNTRLTRDQQILLSKNLRTISALSEHISKPLASGVIGNVRTSDVKEKATPETVTRVKITIREEGLEWSTQATESGGEKHTLQPE